MFKDVSRPPAKGPRSLLSCLVLLGVLTTGCTGSYYNWEVRTNSTPVSDSFRPSILEDKPVAIFEAMTSPGLRGNEAGMAVWLAQILEKVAPKIKVIGPKATATAINRNGLAHEYVQMRADAEQSYILNRDILQKVAAAVGARYVFQPRLASFSQTMTERWKVPGFDLRVVQTRSSVIRLSLQLWETDTGELVWTSVAEAVLANEAVTQDPVFLEEETKVALGSVIADLLYGRTSSQYTPLNGMLNQLIEQPSPAPSPKKEDSASEAPGAQ